MGAAVMTAAANTHRFHTQGYSSIEVFGRVIDQQAVGWIFIYLVQRNLECINLRLAVWGDGVDVNNVLKEMGDTQQIHYMIGMISVSVCENDFSLG